MEKLKEVPRETPAAASTPDDKQPARGRGKKPFIILGIAAALLVGGILVFRVVTAGQQSTDDAQITTDIVPVGVRVSGLITRVHVHENQTVKKGDLLVEIDDADYAARVEQAAAELATATAQAQAADAQVDIVTATSKGGLDSARAAVSGSTVGVGSAGAELDAAKAAVAHAEADQHKAEIDLARAKELRAAQAIPQERLENAQIAFDAARAAMAQSQAQLALAGEAKRAAETRVTEARGRLSQSSPVASQITAAHAGADLAHARVKSAEAQLTLAKLQFSYTKVVAPNDGMASKLTVHEGQLVSLGQPVIELVPTLTYLVANFKETQTGAMKPGDRAEVRIDAFPGRSFEAKVESLSGGTGASFSLLPPDNATGNFVKVVQRVPVRLTWVSPPDVPVRAGLSADVKVQTGN